MGARHTMAQEQHVAEQQDEGAEIQRAVPVHDAQSYTWAQQDEHTDGDTAYQHHTWAQQEDSEHEQDEGSTRLPGSAHDEPQNHPEPTNETAAPPGDRVEQQHALIEQYYMTMYCVDDSYSPQKDKMI